ncbi:MAG: hypothetical protein B6D34_03385 [Candidatus Brocadia sp. UTAMX1]|jgi:hypothetical protein|nr:MAG: hypothetical protein B6D34_03385 [Candidatus Brocadia sp. UTAMX1]
MSGCARGRKNDILYKAALEPFYTVDEILHLEIKSASVWAFLKRTQILRIKAGSRLFLERRRHPEKAQGRRA